MKNSKKYFLAILCLLATTYTFANSHKYKNKSPPQKPVTIPLFKGGLELGITALWVRPSSENLNFLTVNRSYTVDSASNIQTNDITIDPNNNWGFVFDIGYVFPNTANDVRLDWMSFHSSYDSSFSLNGNNSSSTAIFLYPVNSLFFPDINSGATAGATMNYKLDAVDLTLGQYVDIYKRLQTRFFTGLRYARIDSDLTTEYLAAALNDLSTYTYDAITGELNSSFNGLGPMIGIRADFALKNGFGLSGSIDGALLVGQLGFNGNQVTHETIDNDLSNIYNYLNWDGLNIIAPTFDAKFGLNYRYLFSNGTLLGIELGYQVTKYYDVIEEIDRGIISDRYDTNVINFDLKGGYLTLHVKV